MNFRAERSLRRRISWFCIPCIARKPSVFACVSNFFELLTHKPSGTSDVETSESLRRLGRFLQKPPCRLCPSRHTDVLATAPSCGGSWVLPRPMACPPDTAARAGRRSSHGASRVPRLAPPLPPSLHRLSRCGALHGVSFRPAPPRPLTAAGARASPPTGSSQTTELRSGICLPGPVGSPTRLPPGPGLAPPISRLRIDHFATLRARRRGPRNRLPQPNQSPVALAIRVGFACLICWL